MSARTPSVARIVAITAALLALLLCSLGLAYVPLGRFAAVPGLVIAAIKSALVAGYFMDLRRAGALVRLIVLAGLGTVALLCVLATLDFATRPAAPADVQPPAQLGPWDRD